MKRIFIFLCSLFLCVFTTNPLSAIASKDTQNAKNDLRILELLPNLLCPLAVDPSIPADFVALSPNGTLDLYDWIYWGPKDVLEAYFEDPVSLNRPVIRVKLSANTTQTGPDSFDKNTKQLFKRLEKEDPEFASIETKWGNYPVIALRAKKEGHLAMMAWVGLNNPEAGWTLCFNLIYPDMKDHPNKEDHELWDSLLMKTTQLTDNDYFKACGQDLQEGYTLVNFGGAKLKMLAEKRQKDGKIQVVVIPESSDIEFHYVDMIEALMGAEWKYKEPMVKVYGEIVINKENFHSIINSVTSIFFKTVPEFSFKEEEANKKHYLIFQKNSDQ